MNPSNPPPELPPEIAFVSIPKALAQFHHLPPHVPVWIHRQEEVEKKGYDFNEGVGVMEELLKAAPGVPGAYLYQLFLRKWPKLMEVNPFFRSGRIAEAIPKLVEILEIDPECPLTCFQLGYCFRATGELEKSESFYRKALRMAPDAGWIHSNLGRTYQALGDVPKAIETFWKALELLPSDSFVLEQLVGLGEIFPLPGQDGGKDPVFIKREDYEKKTREILGREKDPKSLTQVGWRLLRDGMAGLAREFFEKAISAKGAPPTALLGMGTALLEMGNLPEAERFLMECLDANPDSGEAHLALFKVYQAQDEMDLAWEEIQTAARSLPDHLDILRHLARLFREADRTVEGAEWMERLSREHPSSFAPLFVQAQLLLEEGPWDRVQEILRKALALSPRNEEVLLFYTAELGKRDLQGEIVRLLGPDEKTQPFSLTINLGLALSRLKETRKARQVLEDFLARPELSEGERERAQALLQELGDKP